MLDREFIDLQQVLAGEYSLERELGRGGMGIVYLARDVQLDRLVAIKVLPEALAERSEVRERFLREARMAASLSHPHIVPIYRVGEAKGFVFFIMAYVNGETLGERLRTRGPLPIAAATRLLREVTWALSYAHGHGIVHRDIKPDNILIEADTGRALVSDFGIARSTTEIDVVTPGRVMGTAQFMSPEQAASEPLDGRSDLYSLGVVAHLALNATLPSVASNVPASPVPRALVAVIERCLKTNPSERFATGEALAEALDSASAPARAKLPIALRLWTQSQDRLLPLYIYWSTVATIGLVVGISPLSVAAHPAMILLPFLSLVPITIFHARKAYQVLSAGYTPRDLRAALKAWQQERVEELSFELDDVESRWARVLRLLTYGSAAGVAVMVARGFPGTETAQVITSLLSLSTVINFAISNAMGVRLISKKLRTKLVGSVRSMIWNSRVGDWAAKLLTPKHRKPIADLDYRPTEMALGLAVEELFATLPKAYREHLDELPNVVRRLEAHAAAARARVDELTALMSLAADSSLPAAPHDFSPEREEAKRELGASVAALEAVRLDLLRLHGGGADLRSITTALDAARELGEELDRLREAQREVEDVVLPVDLRPHTPV